MKLTEKDHDVVSEERETKLHMEWLYKQLENIIANRMPWEDKKGHSVTIKFSVPKSYFAVIGKVKESLPDGWFKTNAHLYRMLFTSAVKLYLLLNDYFGIRNKGKTKEAIDRFIKIMEMAEYVDNEEFDEMYHQFQLNKQIINMKKLGAVRNQDTEQSVWG